MPELRVETRGHVALVVVSRPPHNFFDAALLEALANALRGVDADPTLRVSVISSDQRSFCAGADFGGGARPDPALIYAQATRIAGRSKPMIAAVNGAAIGGGLGLALTADFRIGDGETRMQANFVCIGLSAGFGLSLTLPRLVGDRLARDLLLSGRRVEGEEALAMGLLDRLAAPGALLEDALQFAAELAANAPKAMTAMRRLLAPDEQMRFRAAVEQELALQGPLFASADFDEGVRAARERRAPIFSGS